MHFFYIFLIVVLYTIIGCDGSPQNSGLTDINKSNLSERNTSLANIDIASNINNDFAFDLYKYIDTNEKNSFISPYSLNIMLNMLLKGAKGDTKEEMLQAANITLDEEDWENSFNALHSDIIKFLDANSSSFKFSFANSFWIQSGLDINKNYLEQMEREYGINIQMVDFQNSSESALENINEWSSKMTNNHIQNIVDKNSVNKNSKIVMVNAMYLKAIWLKSFFHNDTKQSSFQLLNDTNITVPMMHQVNKFRYVKKDDVEVFCMSYKDSDFGLVSFLPANGKFKEFEATLTNDKLKHFISDFEYKKLDLYYPKFEIKSDTINLTDMLIKKGMVTAFSQNADFSKIDKSKSLKLSQVVQQIYFKIDEEGTQTSSASTIHIGNTAEKTELVKFDRPFIVMICHIPTRTVLFMGRVVNPLL